MSKPLTAQGLRHGELDPTLDLCTSAELHKCSWGSAKGSKYTLVWQLLGSEPEVFYCTEQWSHQFTFFFPNTPQYEKKTTTNNSKIFAKLLLMLVPTSDVEDGIGLMRSLYVEGG